MKSLFDFIITPKNKRTNNIKSIGDSELILNTELQNHQYVSRIGVVSKTPLYFKSNVSPGDEVIVHHNVFRRFYDVRGDEKNSKSYFQDNKYFARPDQVYAYKSNNEWKALPGYCFVKPLKDNNMFSIDFEKPLIGIVKYTDGCIAKDQLVGFSPGSEYEFFIEEERLYRVKNESITIKYEYQGDEEEYNPSWTQSS